MSAKSGKQATRGQRQIYEENRSTFFYYTAASATTIALTSLLNLTVFTPVGWDWTGLILTTLIQLCAVGAMAGMMKNVRNEKNQVVDAGADLNDPGAFGEYCKDAVILACLTHLLSLISVYFYLMLLVFPAFTLFKLWKGIIQPWLTYSPPETDEDANDKRQKKREKKVYVRR